MKRVMQWSDDEDVSSSDESSNNGTDKEENKGSTKIKKRINFTSDASTRKKVSGVDSAKKKSKGVDFEALSRHGYKGALSVLSVPPPKQDDNQKQNWSWSTGKESGKTTRDEAGEETYEERQRTRAALHEGEQLATAKTWRDREKEKSLSFSQKEKRKRDIGQASRGKNYVEEEKRLLRESGVYSGFDS